MPDLSKRNQSAELMDDLSEVNPHLVSALQALARMNSLSASAAVISREIILLNKNREKKIRILDLGCGGGDILCSVTTQLNNLGYLIEAHGVDMNSQSIDYAKSYALKKRIAANFTVSSAVEAVRTMEYDVVISSLFLHHLSESEINVIFNTIGQKASSQIVMTDLVRSQLSYKIVWLATHVCSSLEMIRKDGLTSVQGAFTRHELQTIASRSGLVNCKVTNTFPARLLLSWSKLKQ